MSSGWTQTKIVLGGLVDLLACGKCKKTPGIPMRYVTCGHFFCDTCMIGQNTCCQCHIPVRPNEIQPDRMVAQVLEYCNVIINVITKNNSEDLKSLAKAVHQFSSECNGVVPETDSDSEDDVVASTPPGKQSRKRNNEGEKNAEIGKPEPSHSKEVRQQERANKDLEPETKGFVSPTQFSPHQRKKQILPEAAGFPDQSECSPSQRGRNVQPETKGFVSPTQFSPQRKKKNVQPETKGFVSPTQVSLHQRKRNVEPETKGFVDPTQLSPCHKKINVEPETPGFSDAIESSPCHRGKIVNPETKGFVSPTQFSSRRWKKNTQPETAGFVNPTQFSPRQRKSAATTAEPETAGFVDPTQFSPHRRKRNLQAGVKESVDPTDRNENHIEQESDPETIGYLDKTLTPPGRKKKGLPIIKTSKFLARSLRTQDKNKNSISEFPKTDQSQCVSLTSRDKRGKIDLKLEAPPRDDDPVQKHQSSKRNATITESTEFIDPTQYEKDKAAKLQAETEGYRDPSQPPLHSEKDKVSKSSTILDAKPIDQRSKNIDTKSKNYDSSEEMDWMEEPVRKNLHEFNDLILAPESIDVEETLCSDSTTSGTDKNTENVTNYQNVPMEIEHDIVERSILSKHSRAEESEKKTPNTDSNKRTISRVHGDTMENLETEEESPVQQFKRIKSLALSRQSKFRKITQDLDSSMETREARQKLSHEKDKIHENILLDRCEKVSSVRNSTSSASEENIDEKYDDTVEKTSPKRSRRTRSVLGREEPKMSSTTSTIVTEVLGREKRATRKRSTKGSSQEKRDSVENQEIESHAVEESTKSLETRRESTTRLRNREYLDKENLDETSEQNVKDKSADPKTRVDKAKTAVPKSIPKNINKRNAKGETLLHTACVKGQEDYVKILLEAGANPNTKDNANWTPLQEAVNFGHREICKMLLQAGASPNTPAMDNRTALHDAAANDKFEEAALLLEYNANSNVYDKFGKRPIDYAVSSKMQALLTERDEPEKSFDNEERGDAALDQSIIIPNSKVVVLPSNLNNKNRKLLAQLASKLKVEVAMTFRSTVTHVVVETNDRNITELTYNVMLAILQGKWILNSQWITISSDLNDISEIDLELFEVHGAPNPETPTRARTNEEKQNPRLFNNCYFYFAIGPRCTWSYEKFEFTKESLTTLVLGGQGEILHREPDPEDVKDYKLTPFHVAHKPIHPLYKCSHYIIYMPGKDEPRVKYNMPHIKSLPVGWFLECIEKFTLLDPVLMGIS